MPEAKYMKRAISLAKKGAGWVNPNPLVGAVIVSEGEIIGEGYHERFGELHAERNAIKNLTKPAKGATIYVTLEPCCHYGKTPPCTEAIIENEIAKVVIGSRDPNPKVAGMGVAKLREAGIEVVEDFMRDDCDKLNQIFFHYITKKTPYVTMKYAMTADGKIATKTGASKWISGEKAREHVQSLRNAHMGIMVGIGTVLADDPMLNCRVQGGKSPLRIICDSKLRLPIDSKIAKSAEEYETIAVCAVEDIDEGEIKEIDGQEYKNISGEFKKHIDDLLRVGVRVMNFPKDKDGLTHQVDLNKLMIALGNENIDSILLEGGGTLNDSALASGIVNEIKAFVSPKIFGGRGKSPVEGEGVSTPDQGIKLKLENLESIGEDLLLTYKVNKE